MASSSAKNRRIIEKFEREVSGSIEPTTIKKENYRLELMYALNYYNVMVDNKVKKKWVLDYVKKNHPTKLDEISELPDYHFHTLGAIIRMKTRGIDLAKKDLNWVDTKIEHLVKMQIAYKNSIKEVEEEKEPSKNVVNIQEKILEKAHEFSSEFDYAVDEFITKDIPLPPVDGILKSNNVSRPVANHIPKFYTHIISELKTLLEGKDEQLNEAWSHVSKSKIKKLLAWYESIGEAVKIYGISTKVRKPRTKKVKPAGVLVKNLKYKMEDSELGIKSENPADIIGSNEVWVFDIKYRKLARYVGENISVKGTTLVNFEPEKSSMKTIRKPEMLKEFATLTRKKMEMGLRDIKGTTYIPTGRINSNCIILKVFK